MRQWLRRAALRVELELTRSLDDRIEAALAWWDARRGYPWLRARFRRNLGYDLNLDRPRTMNEKINWRKIHDRRPIYPVVLDKYAVRHFVARRLGQERASALFPRLLGVTRRPSAEWLRQFPAPVAFKANHGSGWNLFVMAGDTPDYPAMARQLKGWMRQRFNRRLQEWGYWGIVPRILAEEMLLTAEGRPASDLKFHVFRGKIRLIQFIGGRLDGNQSGCMLDPDWRIMDLDVGLRNRMDAPPPQPAGLSEMMELAADLGRPFDYVRVDFLIAGDEFRLNELTLYRGSGLARIAPAGQDLALGRLWRLPRGGKPHAPRRLVWPFKARQAITPPGTSGKAERR